MNGWQIIPTYIHTLKQKTNIIIMAHKKIKENGKKNFSEKVWHKNDEQYEG